MYVGIHTEHPNVIGRGVMQILQWYVIIFLHLGKLKGRFLSFSFLLHGNMPSAFFNSFYWPPSVSC